jgi:hypothetical protein
MAGIFVFLVFNWWTGTYEDIDLNGRWIVSGGPAHGQERWIREDPPGNVRSLIELNHGTSRDAGARRRGNTVFTSDRHTYGEIVQEDGEDRIYWGGGWWWRKHERKDDRDHRVHGDERAGRE